MLLKGGNAVDAALATAITLTVVEPTSNGIGSDAFCILWDGKKLHGLNASGRSPAGWTLDRFKSRARDAAARLGLGHGARARSARGVICRRNSASCLLPISSSLRSSTRPKATW